MPVPYTHQARSYPQSYPCLDIRLSPSTSRPRACLVAHALALALRPSPRQADAISSMKLAQQLRNAEAELEKLHRMHASKSRRVSELEAEAELARLAQQTKESEVRLSLTNAQTRPSRRPHPHPHPHPHPQRDAHGEALLLASRALELCHEPDQTRARRRSRQTPTTFDRSLSLTPLRATGSRGGS